MAQRGYQEQFKIPAAVDAVKAAVDSGRKVVVFVSRVEETEHAAPGEDGLTTAATADRLREALEAAGVSGIGEITGKGGKKKSAASMSDFQSGKSKVVIATIESGGTGINLDDTTGSAPRTVVFLTPPLSGTKYVQAAGRVWRTTTKSKPELVNLYSDTDVDRWNKSLIDGKMKTLNAVSGSGEGVEYPEDISEGEATRLATSGEFKETGRKAMSDRPGWQESQNVAVDRLRTLGQPRDTEQRLERATAAASVVPTHAAEATLKTADSSPGSATVPHQKHLDLVTQRAASKSAIRFKGDTFANKDRIKELGAKVGAFAKWDGDAKVWRIEPQWAKDKDALAKGLHSLESRGVTAYTRLELAVATHAVKS